jgi:ribosomal protein L37AE/L43A
MHGKTMKIIEVHHAKLCSSCKNTKVKLLKTNVAIWFNKMCRIKHLKPNNININVNGKKPQDKKTTNNAVKYRINQEINKAEQWYIRHN